MEITWIVAVLGQIVDVDSASHLNYHVEGIIERVVELFPVTIALLEGRVDDDLLHLCSFLVVNQSEVECKTTNLSENALRHAPPGTSITLRTHTDGDSAVLEVEDLGPGIAPEDALRIFDRFYRLDEARSADDGGAGLGLSIVKWVVELHRGTIRPEAAVPSGCRMVVRLPLPPSHPPSDRDQPRTTSIAG